MRVTALQVEQCLPCSCPGRPLVLPNHPFVKEHSSIKEIEGTKEHAPRRSCVHQFWIGEVGSMEATVFSKLKSTQSIYTPWTLCMSSSNGCIHTNLFMGLNQITVNSSSLFPTRCFQETTQAGHEYKSFLLLLLLMIFIRIWYSVPLKLGALLDDTQVSHCQNYPPCISLIPF